MAVTYPPLELRAAPANPITTGTLYTAATIVELPNPARIDGGARIEQTNAGEGFGTWPLDCPTPADVGEKRGQRAADLDFPAFAAWAADECSLVGTTEAEVRELAVQRLRLNEERIVSEQFAETLLEDAGTPATETTGGLIGAVAAIEEVLGESGVRGVIHASRRHLVTASDKGMLVRGNAGRLETPGGHAWAFGLGYRGLGDVIVATGPTTIYRTPVITTPSIDHGQNERTAVAEREVMPTYELFALAHQIGA